jgi:hypothetical protein
MSVTWVLRRCAASSCYSTNYWLLVILATKCYTVEPNNSSRGIASILPWLQNCVSVHMHRAADESEVRKSLKDLGALIMAPETSTTPLWEPQTSQRGLCSMVHCEACSTLDNSSLATAVGTGFWNLPFERKISGVSLPDIQNYMVHTFCTK